MSYLIYESTVSDFVPSTGQSEGVLFTSGSIHSKAKSQVKNVFFDPTFEFILEIYSLLCILIFTQCKLEYDNFNRIKMF